MESWLTPEIFLTESHLHIIFYDTADEVEKFSM